MASKRRQRRKSCEGKIAFPNQTAAVAALISLERKGYHGLRSYPCRWGKHWHIGHYGHRSHRQPGPTRHEEKAR